MDKKTLEEIEKELQEIKRQQKEINQGIQEFIVKMKEELSPEDYQKLKELALECGIGTNSAQ